MLAACGSAAEAPQAAPAPQATPAPTPAPAPKAPAAPAPPCVADGLGPLTLTAPSACKGAACVTACDAGTAAACVEAGNHALASAAAHDHDHDGDPDHATASAGDPVALFTRACRLGNPNGCTNLGAELWIHARPETAAADAVCAARLFEASCAAGEHFGCGMAARLLIEKSTDPADHARGRARLASTCASLGGFACRAIAVIVPPAPDAPITTEKRAELLQRACSTGDADACWIIQRDGKPRPRL